MSSPRRASWPPHLPVDVSLADLADDRVAFLAAKPELDRRSRGTGSRAFWSMFAGGIGRDVARDRMTQMLESYSIAIDAVTADLSADERMRLRHDGVLPSWFFGAVEARRKAPRV